MKYGEAHKSWIVDLDGKEQLFRFEHQFWTGEKKYYINDELIKHIHGGLLQSAKFVQEVPFSIGSHKGMFKHRAIGRVTFNDLIIGGEEIKGSEKSAMRFPLWLMTLLIIGLIYIALFSIKNG